MLRKERRDKFQKANYIFQSGSRYATDVILGDIAEWAKDTNTEVVYCATAMLNNEKSVIFAFKSEEDMGMFALRWQEILEQCYTNSSWRQLIKVREQIIEKYKTGELKTIAGPDWMTDPDNEQ